ncbi:hypothetical protein TK43_11985 [Roseovarius sp. JS7-11]|nr:hypothetical protein TK43_11985 [Roseovarius sp. JS7-11]
MDSILFFALIVSAFILGFWFCIVLCARMAKDRNRSPFFWVLVSLVGSPLVAILLLLLLGEAEV